MGLIALLVQLVVLLVVAYIAYLVLSFIISRFGIPEPVGTIIMLVIGLILLLAFLSLTGLYPWAPGPALKVR